MKPRLPWLVLIHGRHLDRHARTGIDHALLEQSSACHSNVDLVVEALGIDEPIRSGAGGHRRHQVSVAVLDLSGRRVWKDGDGAAGLIGLAGVSGTGVTGSDVYVKLGELLR